MLDAIESAPNRPADAVANDFFRSRRYIGSGDRRAVSERVWNVLRARRRLGWWLNETRQRDGEMTSRAVRDAAPSRVRVPTDQPKARLLVAASLLLEGWAMSGIRQTFSGGQFAPAGLERPETAALARIEGHSLDHPDMPDAVRLEIPDWLLPRLTTRFGAALRAEITALSAPAPLDLRVNCLKADRAQAQAALAAEGWEARPTPISPWGLRIDGRRPVTAGTDVHLRCGGNPG